MKVRLTTLSENTTGIPGTYGEQGLSILIETGSNVFLLDTGQTSSATYNGDALGVDLSSVTKVVLSHGHFDHTGGLRPLMQSMRKEVEVICHPDVWAPKYGLRKDTSARFIGVPFRRVELESLGARFTMSREPVMLADHVMTLGEVPMVNDFETIDSHLVVKYGSDFRPDSLLDDQGIVIDTGDGLAVVLGCAHRGIINSLEHARKVMGVEKINLVVGGSHLVESGEERIWRTVEALKELNVASLGLCHCTSLPAAAIMAREFGDAFFFNSVGKRVEVGQ